MSTHDYDYTFRRLPVKAIFIDTLDEEISLSEKWDTGGVRTPHETGAGGYQRDPYKRLRVILGYKSNYNPRLLRPLAVSMRADGRFAAIDGGGRWLLAQMVGDDKVPCIVYEGLSREEESKLFWEYDKFVYHLRPVEQFLAKVKGLDEQAVRITANAAPWNIHSGTSRGMLDCVGRLEDLDEAFDVRLGKHNTKGTTLSRRVAKLTAKTWGGYNEKTGEWGNHDNIDGIIYAGAAVVLSIMPTGFNIDHLERSMSLPTFAPTKIKKQLLKNFAAAKDKAINIRLGEKIAFVARLLTNRANEYAKKAGDEVTIEHQEIPFCPVIQRFKSRNSGYIARDKREAMKAAA